MHLESKMPVKQMARDLEGYGTEPWMLAIVANFYLIRTIEKSAFAQLHCFSFVGCNLWRAEESSCQRGLDYCLELSDNDDTDDNAAL